MTVAKIFFRDGFTMIEIVVVAALMVTALGSVIWMNINSQKGSADAYYDYLALTLAKEPLEFFRGHGYKWTKDYLAGAIEKTPGLVPDEEYKIPSTGEVYPCEAGNFNRFIAIEPFPEEGGDAPDAIRGFKIIVSVTQKDESPITKMFGKGRGTVLGCLVMESQ